MRADGPRPNILLDNLLVENSASVVLVSGAKTILPGKLDIHDLTSFGIGIFSLWHKLKLP